MESIVLLLQQHLFLDNGRRLHNTGSRCTMNRPAGDGFFTACLVNGKTQRTRARGPPGALLQSGACAETGRDPESETARGFHLRGQTHRCEKQSASETMRPCVQRLRVHVQLGFMASRRPSLLSVNNNMENLRVSLDKKGKLTGPHV